MDTLFSLELSGWQLRLSIHVVFIIAAALVVALKAGAWVGSAMGDWCATKVALGFGPTTITLCRSHEVIRVAHEAWTEIITRKAGLTFDPDNDLIEEVYNSWYDLFRQLRRLLSSIPPDELRRADANALVSVVVAVMNDGLRPHLTKWHAKFRHWYKVAQLDEPDVPPQELQRQFPQYQELLADLMMVNSQMVDFADQLRDLVYRAKGRY